jgi:hypothetical protein
VATRGCGSGESANSYPLLILPIDSRKITGIVLDKLTHLGTTSPWAEYVVPIVQVKQPNPIASNLPTFHRQEVQEKAFPILRLTRQARPLSKAMLLGGLRLNRWQSALMARNRSLTRGCSRCR